jgi:hypothetical protein
MCTCPIDKPDKVMNKFDDIDYYTDASLIDDPYPYFDYLRNQGPVMRLKRRSKCVGLPMSCAP